MNILITVDTYSPLKDGVQMITTQYAEYLASCGHKVTVVTGDGGYLKEKDCINGVNIIRIKLYTKRTLYYGDIPSYIKLIKELAKENDIMINVCMQIAFTNCILRYIDQIECKKVLFLHGMAHFTFPSVPVVDLHDLLSWGANVIRWRGMYLFQKKNMMKYDMVIHLHEKDNTMNLLREHRNNIVLQNTSNWEKYSSEANEYSPYLCVSNYFHDKNQEYVLKAFYRANSKRKLVFVGGFQTKYLDRLKRIKKVCDKKYGPKDVEFVVNEKREETHQRFKNAYAFLFGSKSEKYPVVICEAMKNAVPYISTDVGVVKHLAGGVVVSSVKDMAEEIDKMDLDYAYRKKLGANGLKYAKEYQSFETNALLLESKLKEIILKD